MKNLEKKLLWQFLEERKMTSFGIDKPFPTLNDALQLTFEERKDQSKIVKYFKKIEGDKSIYFITTELKSSQLPIGVFMQGFIYSVNYSTIIKFEVCI